MKARFRERPKIATVIYMWKQRPKLAGDEGKVQGETKDSYSDIHVEAETQVSW